MQTIDDIITSLLAAKSIHGGQTPVFHSDMLPGANLEIVTDSETLGTYIHVGAKP